MVEIIKGIRDGLIIVAAALVASNIGCENHYVPPSDNAEIVPLTEAEFADVQKQAFDYSHIAADLKALEMRVANLEKACIDGKPEQPKFSAQDKPKKLTARERVKCFIYSTEGCKPCAELKAAIESELCGKLGWTCGANEECDFIFRDSNAWPTYPVIEFRIDDSPKRRVFGKMPINDISHELKRMIDNLDRET